MNFLSVLYAKAGITVDGVTTLNNTATGLTPATNDNSTKLATTGYVKNQNYYPYPTGTTAQYVRGDGSLATFTQTGGGGSSVSYYLNGSVSQGTIGGNAYYEMSKNAIIGTNADFSINADGYVAQFVTDAGDPALLSIPGGNWNFEMFFSASSGGGSPSFYVELYKYDGTTLTLIASGSAVPESITGGTSTDLYVTALAVPTTTLTLTDRLAVRVYVNHSGRTITLHTQNGHLCQIITTFTTGLTALNGLTAQVQNFAVGAGGTDFNISSVTDTHTFNLPTASATKRGALSSIDWSAFDVKVDFGDLSATSPLSYNGSGVFSIAQSSTSTNGYVSSTDWNTFNNKQNALTNPVTGTGTANYIARFNGTTTIENSIIYDNGAYVGIGTATPAYKLDVNSGSDTISARFYSPSNSSTVVYIGGTANTGFSDLVLYSNSGSGEIFKAGTGYTSYGGALALNIFNSNGAIAFHPNSVANAMFIATNGYVGIGTSSPNYRLESTTTALFGTTAYGVLNIAGDNPAYIKIKTNIPFSYGNQAYTVNIKGFQYGSAQTLDLQICWHQYTDAFTSQTITSKGSFAPVVRLARESGLVVIVLTWGQYWPKLYVESVHNYLNDGYANGWTWVDENVTGDKTVTLSYKNDFGDGFVKTSAGLVGIGTNNPSYKLDVFGNTRIKSTSYGGLIVETNDVTTIKLVSNSGSTKNWGFATTNLAVNDFGIYQSTSANGDPINAGNPILYFSGTGAATFSSTVNATSFTAGNRTILTSGGVYDNATNGNYIGLGFGAGVIISTNGVGSYVAQNLGNATYPWNNITAAGYIKAGGDFFAQINGGIFFAGTGAYNSGVLSTNSGNDLILQSGGTGRAYLNSVGDFLVGVTSSIWSSTNRGIIQVNGVSQALIGLSVGGVGKGYLFHTGTNLYIDNTANGEMYLGTNGNTNLTISAAGAATFSSSVTATSLIKSGGTSTQYLMADGSTSTLTNPVTGTGTTNYITKWVSGSAVGNSALFESTSYIQSSKRIEADDAGYGLVAFSSAGNRQVVIGVYSGEPAIQGTLLNGTSRQLSLNANGGNVLIGTTTDADFKLDVNGNGRFSGNIRINSVPTATSALTTVAADWANGSTIYTSIRIGAAADSLLAGVELRTYSNYAVSSGTEFRLYVNNTSNVLTEALRIATTGAATFSSSVTASSFSNAGLQSGEVFNATKSNAGYFVGYLQNTSATGYGLYIQNGSNSLPAIRISNAAGTVNAINLYGSGIAEFGSTVTSGGNFELTSATTGLKSNVYDTNFYASNASYWNVTSSAAATGGALLFKQGYEGTTKGYVYWDGDGFGLLNNLGGWSVRANYGASYGGSLYGNWESSGTFTATNFIVPGGTSAQFLKANGTLDSNVYLTSTSSTFSYTASVTLSPTWQNTGVSSLNLGTGVYLVSCYAHDFAVGGLQYECTYAGIMYFFAGTTNGSNANEIVLHHTGHADNGRYIYLRTLSTTNADGKTYLQISGNGTNSGASNYQLTFKKLL